MLKRLPRPFLSFCILLSLISCATDSAKRRSQSEASRYLGERFIAEGNFTGALRELLKAEALYDEDHILQNDLGLAYSGKGKLDQALVHFEKAVELNPKYAEAWNNMGTVYLKLEKWDNGISCFNRALEQLLYATPHFALNNLGEAYRGKGDYGRSIDYYKEALRAEPRFAGAHRGLALTHVAMGDLDAAISSLEKATEYDPEFAAAYYDLGRAYAGKYNREKALAAFKKVLQLVPDSALADLASAEIGKMER